MSTSPVPSRPSLEEILAGVFECTVEQVGVSIQRLSARTRPVQDLRIDSLDLIEWVMEIEERFDVTLPDADQVADQVYKQIFTRADFCLGDMAELVHLRWGSGSVPRSTGDPAPLVDLNQAGFSQLGWDAAQGGTGEPYEKMGRDDHGNELLRRRSDGMPCVLLPGGTASVGYEGAVAGRDERPVHVVQLSPFVIDLELVSTTAFCRFLNSTGVVDGGLLRSWFLLDPDDRRRPNESVELRDGGWRPRDGTHEWPMMLVSWHGARAYARWAHGHDPAADIGPSFLPTEAQWEFAVRGHSTTEWPWGDREPEPGLLRAGRARSVRATGRMPLGSVHALDGISPFGLRGTLGHVWQWCSDWYDPEAYGRRRPGVRDPAQAIPTGVRAERGGSWVGPVSLSRPSYRRGRVPHARGRCLGFRCAAPGHFCEE